LLVGSEEVLICGGKRGPSPESGSFKGKKRGSTADNGSEWICCNRTAASDIAQRTEDIAIVGNMATLIICGNLAIRSFDCCNFQYRKSTGFRDSYRALITLECRSLIFSPVPHTLNSSRLFILPVQNELQTHFDSNY